MRATGRAEGALEALTGLLDLEGFEVVASEEDSGKKIRRLAVVPTDVGRGRVVPALRSGDGRAARLPRPGGGGPAAGRVADGAGGAGVAVPVRRLRQVLHPPRHPALSAGAHATERFLERLAELASHADVSAAARFFGVAGKTAERWYYDHLERRRKDPPREREPVRSLGIDELSTPKGTGGSAAC